MKSIHKTLVYIFLLVFSSCQFYEKFENKKEYNIKLGETFKIYYSTNSCCGYCNNSQNLKNVSIIESIVVKEEKKGCEGCSTESAYIFKGLNRGRDTIRLYEISPMSNCDSLNNDSIFEEEIFFVNVY